MKTYVTFGQTHTHSVNGKTFDKDCIAVIEAEDAIAGRNRAFELFEDKFFTTYTEENWKEDEMLHYFPAGYIPVSGPRIKYNKELFDKFRQVADAIITPACDILPDTYDEEVKAYCAFIEENL